MSREGRTQLWWRLQLATVFLPVLNAVLLATYAAIFTSPRTGLTGALSGVAVGVDPGEVTHRLRRSGRFAAHAIPATLGRTGALVLTTAAPAGSSTGRPTGGRAGRGCRDPPPGVPTGEPTPPGGRAASAVPPLSRCFLVPRIGSVTRSGPTASPT